MSNFTRAEHILSNSPDTPDHNIQMRRLARAQALSTLAVAEAQETANLIAFLNWAERRGDLVSNAEYTNVVKQVKERIK